MSGDVANRFGPKWHKVSALTKRSMIHWWTRFRLSALILMVGTWSAAAFELSFRSAGDDQDLPERMESSASLTTAQSDGGANPQDILAAAHADYGRMVGVLYAAGYFGPVVSITIDGREAADMPPFAQLPSVNQVVVSVDPGPVFHFGTAEIGPLTDQTEVPSDYQSGALAMTSAIEDAAKAGIEGWRALGHAKAQIADQQVIADHQRAVLNVTLKIAPGPRVTFGPLLIAGESTVRSERIRAITGVPTGEVFNPEALRRAAARLRRSGAFAAVSLREADRLNADASLDTELELTDAKPRRFGFGAALQSEEGIMLSGFWMHRNLLGGAERFRVEGEVSGIGGTTNGLDYNLNVGLTRPSTFDADTDLYATAMLVKLEEPHYTIHKGQLAVGVSRYFSEQVSAELGLAYRYSDVNDDLGTRQFSHLMVPIALTWDRRDAALNPTEGTFLRAEAMPFAGLDGSASGARGYLDARAYRSIGDKNAVTFAGRMQFGTLVGAGITETPSDMLFLSGGSGTVRGHTYQSLAITNGATQTGGRSFLGLSGEARAKLTDKVSAVGFYDAGYIGANSWLDDTGGWQSGAGLGLRYDTGIGPIRLDVAAPVAGASSGGVQIYVGIGQAF